MEGHTGSTNPPQFWQSLADNRAIYIVRRLEGEFGVPPLRAIPYGKPGGGVYVDIRRAAFREVFNVLDTDGDGQMSEKELEPARTTLGQWFSETQLSILFNRIRRQGSVDFRAFSEECGIAWDEA